MEEMVTITRDRYEDMLDRLHFLSCLECAGVDNWSGYDYAQELYQEDEEE